MVILIYIMSLVLVVGAVSWSVQPGEGKADIDTLRHFLSDDKR